MEELPKWSDFVNSLTPDVATEDSTVFWLIFIYGSIKRNQIHRNELLYALSQVMGSSAYVSFQHLLQEADPDEECLTRLLTAGRMIAFGQEMVNVSLPDLS